jgi:uncharacterized membrane protein YdjX (TVP38/TMEM64 family)
MTADEVARALDAAPSLVALVDSRANQNRCLRKVEPEPDTVAVDIGDGALVDPAGPVTPELVIESFAAPEVRRRARSELVPVAVMLAALAMMAVAWRWTPLSQWVDPAKLVELGASFEQDPLAPLVVIGVYIVAASVAFPLMVLILATMMVFGPWLGIVYSMTGSLLSGMLVFALGRIAGRRNVERLTSGRFRRITAALRSRGLMTVITVRMLPVAPYSIVNLVLAAAGIGARDFALGTLIGLMPGILALAIFHSRLVETLRRPDVANLLLLVLVSAALVGVLAWLRSLLRARGSSPPRVGASQPERATSTSAITGR